MNSDWSEKRDSPDTLYVPFVWVPDGAPRPTEWLAQHPEAFWVPATLVRGGSSEDKTGAEPGNFDHSPPATQPGDGAPVLDATRAYSQSAPLAKRTAGFVWIAGQYDRQHPVAAFLRINDMFARMGIGLRRLQVEPR